MDFIITLSDALADETFADWPGAPFVAHWNVQEEDHDPASEATQREVFWTLWRRIKWAASHFLVNVIDYSVTRRLNFRA